jgi:hypothetical protein
VWRSVDLPAAKHKGKLTENWVYEHQANLVDAICQYLAGDVAAFIRQRQFNPDSVPPFSSGELEFICRTPQLIAMLPGYGHRMCFFVMNAINRNNKFVEEVLEGLRISTDFFNQEHYNLRDILSVTSKKGSMVLVAEEFFAQLAQREVEMGQGEREAAARLH